MAAASAQISNLQNTSAVWEVEGDVLLILDQLFPSALPHGRRGVQQPDQGTDSDASPARLPEIPATLSWMIRSIRQNAEDGLLAITLQRLSEVSPDREPPQVVLFIPKMESPVKLYSRDLRGSDLLELQFEIDDTLLLRQNIVRLRLEMPNPHELIVRILFGGEISTSFL